MEGFFEKLVQNPVVYNFWEEIRLKNRNLCHEFTLILFVGQFLWQIYGVVSVLKFAAKGDCLDEDLSVSSSTVAQWFQLNAVMMAISAAYLPVFFFTIHLWEAKSGNLSRGCRSFVHSIFIFIFLVYCVFTPAYLVFQIVWYTSLSKMFDELEDNGDCSKQINDEVYLTLVKGLFSVFFSICLYLWVLFGPFVRMWMSKCSLPCCEKCFSNS